MCCKGVLLDRVLTYGLGDDLTLASPVSLRVTPHPSAPHASTNLPCRQQAFQNISSSSMPLKRRRFIGKNTYTNTHMQPQQTGISNARKQLRTPGLII
jgi:hypothetical protein